MMKRKLWVALVALLGSGLSGTLKASDSDVGMLFEEAKSFESKIGEIRNAKRLAGGINCTSQLEKQTGNSSNRTSSPSKSSGKSGR